MALPKKLEAELKKLQVAVDKFMQIHNTPLDTSKHNEVAEEFKKFANVLSEIEDSTSSDNAVAKPSGRRSISTSVGKGGKNTEEDVLTIQELLNEQGYKLEPDGKIGNTTIRTIKMFQGRLGMKGDGLVSPGKNTMKGLLGEIPAGPQSTGISSIIQGGESGAAGYNAYNRGTQGNKILGPNGPRSLINMTLAQIIADQKRPKSDAQTLFAVGKYQMIPVTLKEGVDLLKIDPSTKFNAATQEYLFSDYLLGRKRPAIRAYVQGTGSAQAAQIAGAKEWASIADPTTGKSYYDGSGGNSAHITAEDFLATLDEAKVEFKKNLGAGMEPDAAYRKAVAGVGEEDSTSDTDSSDTGLDGTTDTTTETGTETGIDRATDTVDDSKSQATINKSVGKGGINEAGDVSLVQDLLNEQGENLTVDGKIGKNTINAIKRFQATLSKRTPDGLIEPGKSTITALVGDDTGSSTDTATDTAGDITSQATIKRTVGKGGINEAGDVSLVQDLLNKQGENLTVDGKIGNNTINAIKRFQATLNIGAPDGLIEPGKNTIAALVGDNTTDTAGDTGSLGDPNDNASDTAGDTGSLGDTSDNLTDPLGDSTDTSDSTTDTLDDTTSQNTINKSVGRGGENEAGDVSLIQELLNKKGESLKADGKMGLKTVKAIKRFQKTLSTDKPSGLIEPGDSTFIALTGNGDTLGDSTSQDTINKSVGRGGENEAGDVSLVQELLNKKGESLKADGKMGLKTVKAIKRFQKTLSTDKPSGLIEPGDDTIKALTGGSTPTIDDGLPGPAPGETSIEASVGRGATNNEADVKVIQALLVHNGEDVKVDGKIGNNTILAIESIQYRLKVARPDGVVEPNKNTHKALIAGTVPAAEKPSGNFFSHPGANGVRLTYGSNAVKMNATAEHLLKSLLAASGNTSAKVNSTLRTYYHQARVMIQYYSVDEMARLYKGGNELAVGRRAAGDDIQKFADFIEARDKKRGQLISKHVPGKAIDVVPGQNRSAYVAKAEALIPVSGSGVSHFIRLGQFGEKVDHIEFTFKVV
jgi:peptidoglycan hydrolase-like protein with peptidoglycan-binding domain